jgi:NAD(P)-dependent dehydrogenase (short-subunit alcohol dehydrogenase family)
MEISGSVALVTGAASGIGAAVSHRLAEAGATVVVGDVQDERGQALADELGGTFVHLDVTDSTQVEAAVDRAAGLGDLRILVNSAGIGPAARTVGRDGSYASAHDLDLYKSVIAVNLAGTFDMIRIAGTAMSRLEPTASGERGAIVSMASVAAFEGQIGQAAYASSKGGIVGMTLPIARDLAAIAVRVNTIAPGLVDTPIYGEGEKAEELKARLGESVLFPKRLGRPDELASMVRECVRNSYLNGAVIRVDGGIRMPPR